MSVQSALSDGPYAAGTLTLPTPEGVELHFRIASAGDRAAAFLLDCIFIIVLLALAVAMWISGSGSAFRGGGWLAAVFYIVLFLLQNFYFIWFESRGRGATPGKKRVGLRVMPMDGGSLTTTAVVVRNVMRNLEILLPVIVLANPEVLWPDAPVWPRFFAMAWLVVLLLMPLFNKRRLRVGDMVAGTVVVVAPKAVLLSDLGREQQKSTAKPVPTHAFSDAQLDAYGEYELQVLEDVLRRNTGVQDEDGILRAVAQKIAKKIGWKERILPSRRHKFLLDYYAATRARLEQKMLFGKRKQDKHDR